MVGAQFLGISSRQGAVDLVHPLDTLSVLEPLQEIQKDLPQHGGVILRSMVVEGLQL
ncbi:unknown [Clostridium sp. CAG:1013]|nr:unknown [Clostridium sp. CAG:1013]